MARKMTPDVAKKYQCCAPQAGRTYCTGPRCMAWRKEYRLVDPEEEEQKPAFGSEWSPLKKFLTLWYFWGADAQTQGYWRRLERSEWQPTGRGWCGLVEDNK